ncbi:hypothetical protein Vretimale_15248 [Volvox reticuliferus]|uniref:Uncharacterized protein n=1 Tax=Volvox reticuliferus TaxID=1737510 RepID=A0A8J4GQV1_9CHLO|nr:hypothetical protein Vretimale_15248 [Volvox reticuliferus]
MSKRSRNIEFRCQKVLDGHSKAVASVKFAPSGLLLATASADKTVCLWDVTTGSRISTLSGHTCGISDVSWNPNQRYLATAADDNTLKLWDVETGTCLRTLTGHTNYVFCCNFDPPGHLLASGSFDETMRLWDVRTARELAVIMTPQTWRPLTGPAAGGRHSMAPFLRQMAARAAAAVGTLHQCWQ